MLFTLHTYFLSLLPVLVSIAHCFEKLQQDFLWGVLGEESQIHLVNWKTASELICVGGLGIRAFSPFKPCIVGEWLWRYVMETYTLWGKKNCNEIWV